MTDPRLKLLSRRHRSEKRFKFFGLAAVLIACSFLVMLLSTVVGKGLPAFTHNYVKLPINFSGYADINAPQNGDYNPVYKNGIASLFPQFNNRNQKRIVTRLVSSGAGIELQNRVVANPTLINTMKNSWLPLDDYADLYLKGLIAKNSVENLALPLSYTRHENTITLIGANPASPIFDQSLKVVKNALNLKLASLLKRIGENKTVHNALNENNTEVEKITRLDAELRDLQEMVATLEKRRDNLDIAETLDKSTPSILFEFNGSIVKVDHLSRDKAVGKLIIPSAMPHSGTLKQLLIRTVLSSESTRKFSDIQLTLIERLRAENRIENHWNTIFFTRGASREPEQAGIWGALVGSMLTMAVTLALAFPLGIATAIYLEEFAPKNRLTAIIEVNINNLAAVPSIIFGLLGLSVFLNWFEFPRSAPLVGGLVLALMTLPTIIIASRAAIKAVPPSIREAAFGIGASKVQTVFHHVLPLAMPGMLTGTIIGMAQALGETAPLLMIGMVAFIVDIPTALSDPATVMPVQIYMWADFPEPAFQQKTAAAILVLLVFLVAMNAFAVLLRRRFERRW